MAQGIMFGMSFSAAPAGPEGTTIPFEPVVAVDTMAKNGDTKEVRTKQFCITAMEKYKSRCLEELRVFDYLANRKGSQNAAGSSLFGSTSSGFGGFSSTPAASKPGGLFGFGSNTAAAQPAASAGFGGFGGTAVSKPGGLFGSTTTSTAGGSLFGNAASAQPTASTGFGGFGATTANKPGGLFGSTAASTSGSLFRSNTAPQPAASTGFGAQAQTQTQQSGGNLFGGTSGGFGGFNNATATSKSGNLFGFGGNTATAQPAATTGFGGFGNTATSKPGGLFGSTTTSTAGGGLFSNAATAQPAASAGFGGFGAATTNKPGGLFGSNTAATGLFANNAAAQPAGGGAFGAQPQTQQVGGGLFGNTGAKPGGLFGSTATQQPVGNSIFGSAAAPAIAPAQPPQPPIVLGGNFDETNFQRTLIEAQLSSLPYGDGPLIKGKQGLSGVTSPTTVVKSDGDNVQSQLRKLAMQALSSEKEKSANTSLNGSSLTVGKVNNTTLMYATASPNSSFSYKPIVPLPSLGFAPTDRKSSLNLSLQGTPQRFNTSVNGSLLESKKGSGSTPKVFDPAVLRSANSSVVRSSPAIPATPTTEDNHSEGRRRSVCFADVVQSTPANETISRPLVFDTSDTHDETPRQNGLKSILVTAESRRQKTPAPALRLDDTVPDVNSSANDSMLNTSANGNTSLCETDGYYSEPPLEELEKAYQDDHVEIRDGLTVGRKGYGSVYWPGKFDLSTLDFAQIVRFRMKEVVVYPDDTCKPPVGTDLNRPAEVSLERVWPYDKESKEYIKDPEYLGRAQFRERLERACGRMDARFIDYRVSSGTWTFSVSHFSKYGLTAEDEEDPLPVKKRTRPVKVESSMTTVDADYLKRINSGTLTFGISPYKKYDIIEDDEMEPLPAKKPTLDLKMEGATTYVRQPLVERDVVNVQRMVVPEKQSVRYRYKKIRAPTAGTLWMMAPRIQWHPQENGVILKPDEAQVNVELKKVKVSPLLGSYFRKVLADENREHELDKILATDVLHFSPPSILIELLDSYLCEVKQDPTLDQDQADHEIEKLCRSLLLSPSAPNTAVELRIRFGNWIKQKLSPVLKDMLSSVSLEDTHLTTRVIFECLTHGDVKEAVSYATKSGYYNLALYLSLYTNSNSAECREMFAEQYQDCERLFRDSRADKYMMKIYQLLAGPCDLKGLNRPHAFIECLENLSWMQIIGIFIWYGSSPSDTLEQWTSFYKKMFVTKN